jgi:hypothetical protein
LVVKGAETETGAAVHIAVTSSSKTVASQRPVGGSTAKHKLAALNP